MLPVDGTGLKRHSIERIPLYCLLLKAMGSKAFLNGMYRIFTEDALSKWNDIVERMFPRYKNKINVFG